jgi:HEAT repeat protein
MRAEAKPSIPSLVSWLSRPEVAKEAVQALCSIGPEAKEAIPALRKLVFDEIAETTETEQRISLPFRENSTAHYQPYYDLYFLGSDVLPLLLDMAEVTKANRYATNQIGQLGSAASKAVPKLTEMLRHTNADVRRNAAFALCKIERKAEVVPVLIENLGTGDLFMIADVVEALGKMGPKAKEALPLLEKIRATPRSSPFSGSDDPEERLKAKAATAIRKIQQEDKK